LLQLVLVGLLIAFPAIATAFLDAPAAIDPNQIQIDLPAAGESGTDLSAPPDFSQ
jgi:hypothetical protein